MENRTINHSQLQSVLRSCVRTKRPVFIWGPPGVGKSDAVAQLCVNMGGKLYDVRLSTVEQTDIRGIPFFNKETGKMDWAPPVDLPDAETASKYPIVFLFLDELNSAPPSVQASCYQLILNRKIGTYQLPENCVVIAAGNRDTDKGVTFRMPTPLANRFVHCELRVDPEGWIRWAFDNQIHPDVVGFIENNKNCLFDFDSKNPSKAFATPRSWEFVSQFLKDPELDESILLDLVAGTVGEGMAIKFIAHRKHSSKLPKPKDILTGKVTKLETEEISAIYSLATAISYEMKSLSESKDKKFDEYSDNMLSFFMENFPTEITIMAMRAMFQQFQLPFNVTKMKSFKKFHERFGKLIALSNSLR